MRRFFLPPPPSALKLLTAALYTIYAIAFHGIKTNFFYGEIDARDMVLLAFHVLRTQRRC